MEFLKPLAEFGALGILAGFMAWLYLHERKISKEAAESYQKIIQDQAKQREAEIKVRFGYTRAIENLNQTVRVLGEESSSRMQACQIASDKLFDGLNEFLEEERLRREREAGREEGRREVTAKIHLPEGGKNEPR